MKKFILFFFTFLLIFTGISYATTYPDYSGYVNDFAHVLSAAYVSQLNAKLSEFNHQTTDQIAVVTVTTTQPETIEEYSIHLAEKWKVGQKGKDNGIIMLFAMQDHKMRIEVGRGLEGDLTDIQSKHIQKDVIEPEFKKGNYEQGITNGINSVISTITHGNINPNTLNQGTRSPSPSAAINILLNYYPFILFLLFVVIGIAFSPKTKLGGRGTWGITTFWGDSGSSSNSGNTDSFGSGGFSGGGSSDSW